MLGRALRFVDFLCRASAWVAAALLAMVAVLGMAEILSRWWFNYSIPIAFEYSSYALAFIMFGGSAWALRQRGHIRVNLIMQVLGPGARRVADLIATLFALGVSLYLSYALILFTSRTFARDSVSFFPSQTPLGWPQLALTVGACLISLALLARLLRILIKEPAEAEESRDSLGETLP